MKIPKPAAKAGAWVKEKMPWEEPFIKPWMIDLADSHYPVETKRAREKLHWAPNHRLRDELPNMIDFLKREPRRFYELNKLPEPEKAEP